MPGALRLAGDADRDHDQARECQPEQLVRPAPAGNPLEMHRGGPAAPERHDSLVIIRFLPSY